MNNTSVTTINNQTWMHGFNVASIKFIGSKNDSSRRIRINFENSKHPVTIHMSDKYCCLGTSQPIFKLGISKKTEGYTDAELLVRHKVAKYVFMRYWVWIKSMDIMYERLIANYDSTIALDTICNEYNRQAYSTNEKYMTSSPLTIISLFNSDVRKNLYKAFSKIEIPSDYAYRWRSVEELINEV